MQILFSNGWSRSYRVYMLRGGLPGVELLATAAPWRIAILVFFYFVFL